MNSTLAITVTYGARWHLLSQTISAALNEGIELIIVVDNGSLQDITSLAFQSFGNRVITLRLKCNTGSSGGFKAGLLKAKEYPIEYFLLLDDDNCLTTGSLNSYKSTYQSELNSHRIKKDLFAISGFRKDHHSRITSSPDINPPGSFLGFHLLSVLSNTIKSFTTFRKKDNSTKSDRIYLECATWGGLYFHRSILDRHGLPDDRLFLYEDDTEYTKRITKSGGRILLDMSANIKDIEITWNAKLNYRNSFDALLLGWSGVRAYYRVRNMSYLYRHRSPVSHWYIVNRFIYLFLLRIRAFTLNKNDQWILLHRAIKDGESIRLGESLDYPISLLQKP